ncbi:MAG: pirin family protein [Bacteroidetes bacterium]|nr:pirin family protein [Bacteroidota bacterium]
MATDFLHRSSSRHCSDHGWLKSYHTFSYAEYYHPDRMNFGALRVLNDDIVAGGQGFGNHPHENMEIICIPLSGALVQTDKSGSSCVISEGEVQVISAGTGISHSEMNRNSDQDLKFLNIWMYPKIMNAIPKYEKMSLNESDRLNCFQTIVSPTEEGQGMSVYQDAWVHLSKIEKGVDINYKLRKKDNGVYAFIVSGMLKVRDTLLSARDGIGFCGNKIVSFKAETDTEMVLLEVPLSQYK